MIIVFVRHDTPLERAKPEERERERGRGREERQTTKAKKTKMKSKTTRTKQKGRKGGRVMVLKILISCSLSRPGWSSEREEGGQSDGVVIYKKRGRGGS